MSKDSHPNMSEGGVMRLTISTIILAASIVAAQAQSRTNCKILADATAQMINGVVPMTSAVDDLADHVPKMRVMTSGQTRSALDKFEESRRKLSEVLKEYLAASRSLRNSFEACS